jgi:hypothetical protein
MKIIILFIINILVTSYIFAQSQGCINDDNTQPCCNEIISTDPRLNSDGIPWASNPGRTSMINKFNWMNPTINVYHPAGNYTSNGLPNGGSRDIANPFFTIADYLSNVNFAHYDLITQYNKPANLLDFSPENGWELIHKNNGKRINETDLITSVNDVQWRKGPYFILYNKYTGHLRYFGSFNIQALNYKYIKTKIEFKSSDLLSPDLKYSSLLSAQTNISQPLDSNTSIKEIESSSESPSLYSNAPEDFFQQDFYMAYDPCICHNQSVLQFSFFVVDTVKFNLSGRLLGTTQQLDNSGNSQFLNNFGRNFLTSVYNNGVDYNAGITTWQYMDSLVKAFRQPPDSFFDKIFRGVVKGAISGVDGSLDGVLSGIYNGVFGGPLTNIANSVLTYSNLDKMKDTIKTGLSIFSGLTDQFYSAIYPNSSVPNIGFIEADMALTGEFIQDRQIVDSGIDFDLAVPGSKDTENPNVVPDANYPAYNEALGIFALMETPTLQKYKTSSEKTIEFEYYYGEEDDHYTLDTAYTSFNTIQFRLKEDIKYAINPAAEMDLDKTQISATIFIPDYSDTLLGNATLSYFSGVSYRELYYVNLLSLENLIPTSTYVNNSNPKLYYYQSATYPIGCLKNAVFQFKQQQFSDESPYSLGNDATLLYNESHITKPLIKFTIHYISKPNKYGKVITNTQWHTYPVTIEVVNNSLKDAETDYLTNITNLNELTIAATSYSTSQTIACNGKIYITGNLSVQPGVTVYIISTDAIIISPGAIIGHNIILQIGMPESVCPKLPPQTNEQIHAFCTSNKYKAKELNPALVRKLDSIKAITITNNQAIRKNEIFECYPNPAIDKLEIAYTLTSDDYVTIYISDMLGNIVDKVLNNQLTKNGYNLLIIDVSKFSSGMYYCSLITPYNTLTKSFMVVR